MSSSLFVIRLEFTGEHFEIPYPSVVKCFHDDILETLLNEGAVCSIWSGSLRITPDIIDWNKFRLTLVKNATTLLRPLLATGETPKGK